MKQVKIDEIMESKAFQKGKRVKMAEVLIKEYGNVKLTKVDGKLRKRLLSGFDKQAKATLLNTTLSEFVAYYKGKYDTYNKRKAVRTYWEQVYAQNKA